MLGGLLAGARSLADIFSLPTSDDYYAQRQTHAEAAPLVGVVRTVTATLTSLEYWALRWQLIRTPIPSIAAQPILQNPRGALVVAILRRIAYTIPTLFRSVTQRSDERGHAPWKRLMLDLCTAFLTTNDDQIRGLPLPPLILSADRNLGADAPTYPPHTGSVLPSPNRSRAPALPRSRFARSPLRPLPKPENSGESRRPKDDRSTVR